MISVTFVTQCEAVAHIHLLAANCFITLTDCIQSTHILYFRIIHIVQTSMFQIDTLLQCPLFCPVEAFLINDSGDLNTLHFTVRLGLGVRATRVPLPFCPLSLFKLIDFPNCPQYHWHNSNMHHDSSYLHSEGKMIEFLTWPQQKFLN